MRILEEAVLRFFDQKAKPSPAEEQRAGPVDSLPASGDALARPRTQAPGKPLHERRRQNDPQSNTDGERRRQDRRQNQQNILLDTRTTTCRRRPGDPLEIDTQA